MTAILFRRLRPFAPRKRDTFAGRLRWELGMAKARRVPVTLPVVRCLSAARRGEARPCA